MRKNILFFCLIAIYVSGFSQNEASNFSDNNSDRPRDPRSDQMNFAPNEVLVKFKDDVTISSGTNLKSAGISSIDLILKANGVSSLEKLFPAEKKLKSAQILKDPTGRDMKIPSLHNIYRITVPQLKSTGIAPADIFKFMEELKALPEVEYAEPNYVFTIGDFKPAGPEMTMLEAMAQPKNEELSKAATGLVPNDPLYNSQWGIPATKIDVVWNTTTGDATSVIAILDTGVDWQHPDLAANIWENKGDIPNNGIDDDGNGLIDDIRGWDYINNDNNPMDDNSHGTHVAGIAAAVGNNGIGIAGVNWKAKIMPIKVFQSSGKGDAATIAKGVTYAASKGATVINMSFGSYAESLTLKNTLVSAYATAVLVAAAGNDGTPIGPCLGCEPMYPGAFSFVLGVEANQQIAGLCDIRACFSNFDQDGPIFSQYANLLNYELKAPGTGILSCVPGGNYREYNGTSMAAPLVAGAVSLYRKQKPNESQELLFGNFINSINQHIDLETALNIVSEPKLDIILYSITDTIDGDRDGRPDIGETIELKVKVRNTWGQANDVKVGIEFGEFEDKSTATILTSEATIGSVSAYGSKENTVSLKIKLATNINDGRDIVFKLKTWYGNLKGEKNQIITMNIENGVELKGVISQNMTLYPDKQYFITENLAIAEGATLIIKPGTIIKIAEKKTLLIAGKMISKGKPDSLIIFTKRDTQNTWKELHVAVTGQIEMNYCQISYAGWDTWSAGFTVDQNNPFDNSVSNIIFINNTGIFSGAFKNIEKCVFQNSIANNATILGLPANSALLNSNIINNNSCGLAASLKKQFFKDNCIFNNYGNSLSTNYQETNLWCQEGGFSVIKLLPNYFGTADKTKVNKTIIDFEEAAWSPLYDVSDISIRPSKINHGIVWKVLVNGKDAQDEFDKLDPLGVSKQKFEVYFNRAMDTKFSPTVSMGVRYPYSQTAIAENGSWSADSTKYTVYGTIGWSTGDGLNTIRVTGAKDMDHFEIPIEDRRFRVIVNAAGSLSAGFEATPGTGKVALKWEKPDLPDLLGYNIYRYTYKDDIVTTDTTLVNPSLITETLFTDFDVKPGTKYFYTYKTVRTNFAESNYSKVVAAIPLTSSKGDANGDLNLNALDISSSVSYLLNNNPQPFIFGAADINNDKTINVLDIVSLANLIYKPIISDPNATEKIMNLYLNDDILYIDAPKAVAAIQFDFSGILSMDEIQKLPALDGFETAYNKVGDTFKFIAYSLTSKSIPVGNYIPLLKIKKGSGLLFSLFSDDGGNQIKTKSIPTGIWNLRDNLDNKTAELGQNYPNPLNESTTIPFKIYEPVDEAIIRIVNSQGQEIEVIQLKKPELGEQLIQWDAGLNKGLFAYMLEIRRGNKHYLSDVKKMIVY